MNQWSIGGVYIFPGHRLHGFIITHDPKHKIGEELDDVLYDEGIYRVSSHSKSGEKEEDFVVIDMSNSTISIEELKEKIMKIKGIISIEDIEKLDEGILIDYSHYPPEFAGGRALILREPIISMMINSGYMVFGEPFSSFLYYMGLNTGKAYYKTHVSILRKPDRDKIVKVGKYMSKLIGFGLFDYDIVDDEALIRFYDSLEAEANEGSGRGCEFTRGILVGWFSEFFSRDVSVEERKCKNKGDEYCEFYVKVKA